MLKVSIFIYLFPMNFVALGTVNALKTNGGKSITFVLCKPMAPWFLDTSSGWNMFEVLDDCTLTVS